MEENNLLVEKIIGHKNVIFKNNVLNIWDVPMSFIPYSTYSFLQKNFRDILGEEIDINFYVCGYVQAFNGTQILIKKFGIDNLKHDFFKLFMGQSNMLGLGNPDIKKISKNSFTMKLDTPMTNFYFNKFGKQKECIDYYISGIIAGALSAAYDLQLISIEENCIAKGDDFCFFNIFPEKNYKDKIKLDFFKKTNDKIAQIMQVQNINNLFRK